MKKRHIAVVGILSVLTVAAIALILLSPFDDVMATAGCARPITTTIYATLITILLALLALAVTAYVFVAGFLKDQQKPYEKKSIDGLLRLYTYSLLFLTVFSLVLLLACFLIDNIDKRVPVPDCIAPIVIAPTAIVSFLLLIYTCCIICHDGCLTLYAALARKNLFSAEIKSDLSAEINDVFKWIGDLEMLVERLIQNHRDSFHAPSDESVLRSITDEDFAKAYDKLISYRNYLWVEKRDSQQKPFTYPEYHTLRGAVRELENRLRTEFLQGERMQDQSFTAPFLSLSTTPLHLKNTVFTNTVFEKNPQKEEGIDFHDAALRGADFTRARLNGVNLKAAKCQEAVFTDAVLNHIQADAKSCFERAVFQNTDFGGQEFSSESGIMQFKSASFVNALLVNCSFTSCDFRQAAFNQAVMSGVKLDSVCLSYADLSGAILTSAKLIPEKGTWFDWETYWLPITQREENGRPLPAFTDFWDGQRVYPAFFINLEKCVLAQACVQNYNFVGSRMSDANFSDALIEHCILDRCYGQRATFQETLLKNCRFSFAMLSLADFSHAHIVDCDFSDCDLRDSLLVQTEVQSEGKTGSHFRKANFTHAQARGATFCGCDFTQALFEDVDLRDSIFENCTLKGVSFAHSDLRGTQFKLCDLDGADFRNVDKKDLLKIENCTGNYLDKPSENS